MPRFYQILCDECALLRLAPGLELGALELGRGPACARVGAGYVSALVSVALLDALYLPPDPVRAAVIERARTR
jgi:hypothetical protein